MAIKKWLRNYSTHNEGKPVHAERTLRNKIDKYMNWYISDTVNKYNNKYYSEIKMKPVDVKTSLYINSSKEINEKDPKLKVDDISRKSKYKNIFVKGFVPNWFEEVFVIKNLKHTVPWTYVVRDLKDEEIVGTFYKKELQERFLSWKSNKEIRW